MNSMKNNRHLFIAFVLLSLFCLAACTHTSTSKDVNLVKVKCENGLMVGQITDGVVSFKGIPFAKPPVGGLRWKAPQAPEPSDEEIDCLEYGYTALQYEWPTEPASYEPKSEDCLTLNIWEHENITSSKELKPVMVFFHGGAYGWGGTADPTYDGQQFAKAHDDVILVTCNYRLGIMAWADFSQVEGGEEYKDINLALRDHIAALKWIQKNIAAFGGDPDNVTIFGESAGAWSTTALVISPHSRGLFKRAIAQSGEVAPKDRKAAQEFASFIMASSGAKNMEELMAISGEEWMNLDREHMIADECCHIVADGDIIPEDFDKAIEDAARSGVELLIGSNSDEWNYFMEDSFGDTMEEKFSSWQEDMETMYDLAISETDEEGKAAIETLLAYEWDIVPEEYRSDKEVRDALAKSGLISELWRYEILDFADRFADAGGDTYVYLWKVPSSKDSMYKSAVHAIELAYIFNNLDEEQCSEYADQSVASKAQEAWINFATAGDPSIKGNPWKKYNTDTRETMVIEKDKWECIPNPSKFERELLEKAYKDEPFHIW